MNRDLIYLASAALLAVGLSHFRSVAFAVYLRVATEEQAMQIARYLEKHYAQIVQEGQLRHLPGGMYCDQVCPRDTYQNGSYWGTPISWFVTTLDRVTPNWPIKRSSKW